MSFATVSDLIKVRQAIMTSIRKHKHSEDNVYYTEMLKSAQTGKTSVETTKKTDQMENIIEIR